jgi:hypothetical protein
VELNAERAKNMACGMTARVVISCALASGVYAAGRFPAAVLAMLWVIYAVLADRRRRD